MSCGVEADAHAQELAAVGEKLVDLVPVTPLAPPPPPPLPPPPPPTEGINAYRNPNIFRCVYVQGPMMTRAATAHADVHCFSLCCADHLQH
jgi:hypothetical protein